MKAYSVDLREKIIAAVECGGMSKAQAARIFGVGATSVKRYVKLAEEGRPLSPGKAPGKKAKLDESAMKLLEEDLHARPAVIYEKRADLLCELLGVRVSKSTICRMVRPDGQDVANTIVAILAIFFSGEPHPLESAAEGGPAHPQSS